MNRLITTEIVESHIAIITLNRPEAMNALSLKVLDELNQTIDNLSSDTDIRTVILTGSGDKAFCAGADLKERKGMSQEETIQTVKYIGETITNIEKMPIPVIAAINGAAFGGGLEIALACDIRIGAKHAKLGLTETSLGIIPGAGGTQRLSRLIGIGQAKKLIYTAQAINAEEAVELQLIEEYKGPDQLLDYTIDLAKKIIKNGPIAVQQAKIAIDNGMQTDLHTGLQIEHLCYMQTISTEDRLEGLKAFAEKRKPEYKGK